MGEPSHPDRTRRRLFGRRIGKTLKEAEQQRIETLLPQISVPLGAPLDPASLFADGIRDVWLEVGFGSGEHLAHRAEENPDIGFIGCEPFVNGAAKMLRRIEVGEFTNVRIHDGDAREVFDQLPDASLGRVFVLYPDPWPKRRHWKRRFVQAAELDALARVMKPGAQLFIASDIPDYIRWCLQFLMPHPAFDWEAESCTDWQTPFPSWPGTRYEAKALREERTPTYLTFTRV